jgi:hypothetical protein
MDNKPKFIVRLLPNGIIEVECFEKEDVFSFIEKMKFLTSEEKQISLKIEEEREREEERKEEELTTHFQRIPSQRELVNYIIQKDNFEHSIPEIHQHFFGRVFYSDPNNPEEDSLYRIVYQRLHRAQQKIAREHEGEWSIDWETPFGEKKFKIFRFEQKESIKI